MRSDKSIFPLISVIVLCLASAFPLQLSGQNEYYVTTEGRAGNSGLSEKSAWSWEYATLKAKSGDMVHIKAGDYGDITLTMGQKGVYWKGYKKQPGDINANKGPTLSWTDSLQLTDLPVITKRNREKGRAINVAAPDIRIENIAIRGGHTAILNIDAGVNNVFNNIIITDMGEPSASCNNIGDDPYSGFGFVNFARNVTLENSLFSNIGAEAIHFKNGSNDGHIKYNHVYSGNCYNPTDYGILVSGDKSATENVIISENTVFRKQGMEHGMHGIDLKYKVSNTLIDRNKITGSSIELAFPECRYNKVTNNVLSGYGTGAGEWHTRLLFYNGPSDNYLANNAISNSWQAITLVSNSEAAQKYGAKSNSGGHRNTILNLIVSNVERVIYCNIAKGGEAPTPDSQNVRADSWVIANWTVHRAKMFLTGYMELNEWRFSNLILDQVEYHSVLGNNKFGTGVLTEPVAKHSYYSGNTVMGYNLNLFSEISDPEFRDTNDFPMGFKLKGSSPLINKGITSEATKDYEGHPVRETRDVGAFEYQGDESE